jgi:hypothetical protein
VRRIASFSWNHSGTVEVWLGLWVDLNPNPSGPITGRDHTHQGARQTRRFPKAQPDAASKVPCYCPIRPCILFGACAPPKHLSQGPGPWIKTLTL